MPVRMALMNYSRFHFLYKIKIGSQWV
jgi:hypothetical protein